MVVRLQVRHDTKENWKHHNPILSVGEIGIEIDNETTPNRMKIGNGKDNWENLPYYDASFMHTTDVVEHIYGDKTFKDSVTMDCNLTITDNYKVIGLSERAERDSNGNVITENYQKKLAHSSFKVDQNNDWNDIVEEGIYSVDVTAVGYNLPNHTPYDFSPNMCKLGMLTVNRDCENKIIQIFTPIAYEGQDENTVMSIIYRTNNILEQDGEVYHRWSSWITYTSTDVSLVHTSNNETIGGIKTFTNNMYITSGNVTLGDEDTKYVIIKNHDNSMLEDNVDALYLSTKSSNIILRPNGRNNAEGEVSINQQGLIDGRITRDSEGNEISSTYAKIAELSSVAKPALIVDPLLLTSEEHPTEYQALVDRLLESFDISTLTTVGTPIVKEDGVVSGFSASNYFKADFSVEGTWNINLKVQPSDLESSKTPLLWYSANNSIEISTNGNLIINVSDTNSSSAKDTLEFATNFEAHTEYSLKISYDGSSEYTVAWQENEAGDFNTLTKTSTYKFPTSTIWNIGSDGTNYFKGSFHLHHLSVVSNGEVIYNTHLNQIDTIKKDDFVTDGSPTISVDGVAYNFSTANRIRKLNISTGNTFEIFFKVKTGTNTAEYQTILRAYGSSESDHLFTIGLNNSNLLFKTNSITKNTYALEENTEYNITLGVYGDSYNVVVNDTEVYSGDIDSSTYNIINCSIGCDNNQYPFNGYIDLNMLQVLRDEIIAYQPLLRIPYVYSRYGIKIVEGRHRDRVDDCYEQFKTGNYFILDVINKTFRMPYDTVDGFTRILYRYRNGKNYYEYNSDLECSQMGHCTSVVYYAFQKPFADNNYILPVACSTRDKNGFTPTETTDFIAKGIITLG